MWVLERGGSSEIICSGWLSYRRRRSERLLAKFPTTAWFGVGGLPPRLNSSGLGAVVTAPAPPGQPQDSNYPSPVWPSSTHRGTVHVLIRMIRQKVF